MKLYMENIITMINGTCISVKVFSQGSVKLIISKLFYLEASIWCSVPKIVLLIFLLKRYHIELEFVTKISVGCLKKKLIHFIISKEKTSSYLTCRVSGTHHILKLISTRDVFRFRILPGINVYQV